MQTIYTSKAYDFARIGAIAFIVAIVIIFTMGVTNEVGSILIGLSMAIACGSGAIGSWYSIKSIKEPLSRKKLISMAINFSLSALLLATLLANFRDILRWTYK